MYVDDTLYFEEDDQCSSCRNLMDVNYLCPLVDALMNGIVGLHNPVHITNCNMYVKYERHLKVVK